MFTSLKPKFAFTAAALALACGGAMAQEAQPLRPTDAQPPVLTQPSTTTRAEVKAEILSARQDGSLSRYDTDTYVQPPAPLAATEAVDDEPMAPVDVLVVDQQVTPTGAQGVVLVTTTVTEAGFYPVAIETEQPKTRDEVKAEFREARLTGQNDPFNPDPYVNSPMPLTQE